MKLLNDEEKELLKQLIHNELLIIEKGFSFSIFTGNVFLENAITEFRDTYLKRKYGEFIPSMCIEYRYFIVGLLKEIKDEFRAAAIQEVLIPKIGKVTTEELLKTLQDNSL